MDHEQFIKPLLTNLLNLTTNQLVDFKSAKDDKGKTSIFITTKSDIFCCPFCGSISFRSKGFYDKKLKVPNFVFNDISVFQRVRRFTCVDCHHSFSDTNHLTPNNHSVSYSTITHLMELLKNPKITFKAAAELTNLSETTVIRIFDKYCHIAHIPFPEAICIDEVYTKNSDYDSKFSCIFYDFFNKSILDVIPCRRKNYLHSYLQKFKKKELDNVHYICIDMYEPYRDIAKYYFKKAIICADSFHVVKHLNDDLSKLRVRIMNSYDKSSNEYYLLKEWKNLLLNRNIELDNKGKYNKRLGRYINFRQLLELILSIDPQLRQAYDLKERYMMFNSTCTIQNAPEELSKLINDFTVAAIPEYDEFVKLLNNWKQEIINSFTIFKGKRINSSVAESMNSTVSELLFNTKGIHNSERRKKRIMYAVNKTGFLLKP